MNYREPCGNTKEKTGNISHVHGHERFDIKNDELWGEPCGEHTREKRKKRRDFTHLNGHENFENNDELLGTKWEHKRKGKKKRGYFAHLSRHERLDTNNELLEIIWEHEIIIIKKRKGEGRFFSVWGQVHSIWV